MSIEDVSKAPGVAGGYSGRYNEVVPQILKAHQLPGTVYDVMQARVKVAPRNHNNPARFELWNNPISTIDGIVLFHESAKLFLAAPELAVITPTTKTHDNALRLTPEQYEAIEGEEFSLNGVMRSWPDPVQAGEGSMLLALARGDKTLLENYFNEAENSLRDGEFRIRIPAGYKHIPRLYPLTLGSREIYLGKVKQNSNLISVKQPRSRK
jgi:hypothetical protein